MILRIVARLAGLAVLAALGPGAGTTSAQQLEWLCMGSKELNPIVFRKSGIGTANAVAEARITRQAAEGHCQNWEPRDVAGCVQREMAGEQGKVYRATADCQAGRITTADGGTYTLAGVWDNRDIGGGRTRWRDASGQIVGRDNASGGLCISQQWEVLCPGPPPVQRGAAAANAPAPARSAPPPAARTAASPATSAAAAQPSATLQPAAQTPSVCGGQPFCTEVTSFAATVVDFRTSTRGTRGQTRLATATVRFQNKSDQPLILGYVQGSGIITDENGNRYVVYGQDGVRGIGEIRRNLVDPKFALHPGEASDARFELAWNPMQRDIIGIRFELDLTIREIEPVSGSQFRLGREHAIGFSGLGRDGVSAPATAPAAAAAPAPAAPPAVDPCAGVQRCASGGPFAAQITQVTQTRVGNQQHHVLRLNVQFRNLSNQPIILAYVERTSMATDNYGNRYAWGRAGTQDNSVTGIGMERRNRVDTQFVLQPGQSRSATFQVTRFSPGRNPLGNRFTYEVTISHVEVLPSGEQVRVVRQYPLVYQNIGVGAVRPAAQQGGSTRQRVMDALTGRQPR
jgi:hypothetical protein